MHNTSRRLSVKLGCLAALALWVHPGLGQVKAGGRPYREKPADAAATDARPTTVTSPLCGLGDLYRVRDAVARRASSADPNWQSGFFDSRPLPPGETLVLADLDGPGIIHHIWLTARSAETDYPRLLTLRVYWDDETAPSVECPLGDFFGVGLGLDRELKSLPVSDTSDGVARNCFWPMPFRRHARITLTNEGRQLLPIFYYNIDWERVDSLPGDTACFHAHYRQEYPTRVGHRYVVADIEGRGQYVGTVLSVRQRFDGWYGEGDDLFFLDGASTPTLRGTGTEDYFCSAWGFQQVCTPFYGAPLFEGTKRGDRTSVYRWHLPDPIRFDRSLRFELEHNGDITFPSGASAATDRADDFSSVAYWYQVEPHKPWPPIPRGYDRLYPASLPDSPFDPGVGKEFEKIWLRALLDARKAALTPVNLPKPLYDGGTVAIEVPNPTDVPMRIQSSFRAYNKIKLQPATFENTVPPGKTGEMHVALKCDAPLDLRVLDPVIADWTCTFLPPGRPPVPVTFPHRIVFDAPFPCERTQNPIVIDGRFDDWPGGLPFVCRQPAQIREQAQTWTGPADCSFRFALAHDDTTVYFALDVTDDDTARGAGAERGLEDSVQVQFAAPARQGNPKTPTAAPTEVVLSFNASRTPKTFPYYSLNPPEGTRYRWRATNTGYAVELALPAAWLNRAEGGQWNDFRFNLAVYDFDAGVLAQLWWRPAWNFEYNIPGAGTFVRE